MPLLLPALIGHRGACAYAPENTLESLRTAAEMGAKWVEIDVKLTSDGVPILMHDDLLDRTTNGFGPVAERTLADLRDLEAGSWFADSFSGIKIPTLEEAIDVLLELNLGLNLEIKACPGREVETAEATLDILSRVWDEPDRLLLTSWSPVALETALDMAPEWPRELPLRMEDFEGNWQELADYVEAAAIALDGNACTREQVEAIMDSERQVLAYTINDPQRAQILRSWGVDGLLTDAPDVLAPVLAQARH